MTQSTATPTGRKVRHDRLAPRRRSWLWTACAAALVLMYLVLWTFYSMTHLSSFVRYQQLAPGAVADHLQADFRLVSLVQTEELAAAEGDEPQIALANTVWVVAELEVVRRAPAPDFACLTELLGPGKRAWPSAQPDVTRAVSGFCRDHDVRVGEPYRLEQVYLVPTRYAGDIYGVVVVNHTDANPDQVLTPPR